HELSHSTTSTWNDITISSTRGRERVASYDVTADGQRFLVKVPASLSPITVVVNSCRSCRIDRNPMTGCPPCWRREVRLEPYPRFLFSARIRILMPGTGCGSHLSSRLQ